jgi:hypothetical protein
VGTAGNLTLQRRRVARCREALWALHGFHGRVRRLVAAALGTSPELQQFGPGLVRGFRRSGAGWERRALDFADELIAMSAAGAPSREQDALVRLMTEPGGRAHRSQMPGV